MRTDQLYDYLKTHWPKIKQDLLKGAFTPYPVKRKEIPKSAGGIRLLGIPTVLDRFVQQAISQVLGLIWEPFFFEYSYGFRPGRTAHQAVMQGKDYMVDGCTYVVDMDLSKFFDRVNHDRLMSRLAERIKDKRVLKLIRRYLRCGVMIEGVSRFASRRELHKAGLFLPYCPISFLMNWTRSWKRGGTGSSATPTTS